MRDGVADGAAAPTSSPTMLTAWWFTVALLQQRFPAWP